MSKWRGYLIESISFVNPKGLKQWLWFLVRLPVKLALMHYWELKYKFKILKNN